jgi:hypothetical protein
MATSSVTELLGFWTFSIVLFLYSRELAQYAYEEGHKVGWDDARVLEIESNSFSCRFST